jgi:hypothetical protein
MFWNLGRSDRTKFSTTGGNATGELGWMTWMSVTGVTSTTAVLELLVDRLRLARIGTTADVNRTVDWSISCRARFAGYSEAGGMI